MILGMEIGLAIFGLLALVTGKMTVSKTKVVVGVPARLLGLLALMPLPLAFGAGVLYAMTQGPANVEEARWTITGIEAGIVILIAILVFAIGASVAVSPEEAKRRAAGRDDDFDEEDDRPRRRDRDRADEDEGDEDRRDRSARPG